MENFKKALKVAITEQVEGIRFESNKPPVLIQFSSERELTELGSLDQGTVGEITQSLIPETAETQEKPQKGELSIVNFGELKLIGWTGPDPKLFVFIPPQGNQLFVTTWNQVNEIPQDTSPAPISEDVDSMFSISSVSEEASYSPSSGDENPMQDIQPDAVTSSYDQVENTPPPPPMGVSLSPSADELSDPGEQSNSEDLDALGFSNGSIPPSTETGATGTVFSSEKPPVASMEKTEYAPPSAIQESPLKISSDVEPMPSQEELNSDKPHIYFGATLPDEMIDPNQSNPIDNVLQAMIQKRPVICT